MFFQEISAYLLQNHRQSWDNILGQGGTLLVTWLSATWQIFRTPPRPVVNAQFDIICLCLILTFEDSSSSRRPRLPLHRGFFVPKNAFSRNLMRYFADFPQIAVSKCKMWRFYFRKPKSGFDQDAPFKRPPLRKKSANNFAESGHF